MSTFELEIAHTEDHGDVTLKEKRVDSIRKCQRWWDYLDLKAIIIKMSQEIMNTLQVKKNLSKETKHKEQFRVEKYSKNKKMEGKIVN